MNEVIRVLKTFWAYLLRPDLYPELGRKMKKNVLNRKSAFKGKEKAQQWLASQSMSTEAFLNKMGIEYISFQQKFSIDYKEAKKKEEECPVAMGGAGNLDILYLLSEHTQSQAIVETGVAYGWSSFALLESLASRNGTLYSSDMPYLALNADQYVGVVVPDHLRSYWKLFRYADRESLPKIFLMQNTFDLVHYDSDKSYEGMMWAYEQLYPKIRTGGYLISDDVGDNGAFMDFCYNYQLSPSIISFEDKYIGILQKT